MYRVFYEKRVFKDLDKIPKHALERITPIFSELANNPFNKSRRLSGMKGLYRIRQGDYRIVYTVNSKLREVKVLLVRHRKDSYRDL